MSLRPSRLSSDPETQGGDPVGSAHLQAHCMECCTAQRLVQTPLPKHAVLILGQVQMILPKPALPEPDSCCRHVEMVPSVETPLQVDNFRLNPFHQLD